MKLKKIGPCKILRKFLANAYGLEFPADMDISPIFNVENLYSYRGDTIEEPKEIQEKTEKWRQQIPTVKPVEINRILDKRVARRTKNNEYFEYLVKWKAHSVKDSTLIIEQEILL